MHIIASLLSFSLLLLSSSLLCPPNTIKVSDQCQGKSACSFSGVDPSRYVIQKNECKYCQINSLATGDDCTECPKNTFGSFKDNTCHSKNECKISGVDPSRYVVQNHECKYCLENSLANGDVCVECPKNTFGRYADNICHSKNECSFSNVDVSRYVVQGHECKYCLPNNIAQGDECVECPKNTFGRYADNSCHGKNECSFSNVDPSRYVVQGHECKYCLSNNIAQGDECQECPKNTFGRYADNSCHGKNECSFSNVDVSRYVVQGHECKYCLSNNIAQGDQCQECPKNTFGKYSDNFCHGKDECYFSGVDASRYVIQGHECKYCNNGYLAYGDDCMSVKEYPFFEGVKEQFILPAEKNFTSNLKSILSNLRKSLEDDFQIKIKDLDEEIKDITIGDPIAKIGTMIAGLKIGCQAVDVLKNKFSALVMSSFSQYVDDLGNIVSNNQKNNKKMCKINMFL